MLRILHCKFNCQTPSKAIKFNSQNIYFSFLLALSRRRLINCNFQIRNFTLSNSFLRKLPFLNTLLWSCGSSWLWRLLNWNWTNKTATSKTTGRILMDLFYKAISSELKSPRSKTLSFKRVEDSRRFVQQCRKEMSSCRRLRLVERWMLSQFHVLSLISKGHLSWRNRGTPTWPLPSVLTASLFNNFPEIT